MNILSKMRRKAKWTKRQLAEYLDIPLQEYITCEDTDITEIDFQILEKLADLYHVEEYDILTEKADSQTFFPSPMEEKEMIPFFKMIENYMKMERLLSEQQ